MDDFPNRPAPQVSTAPRLVTDSSTVAWTTIEDSGMLQCSIRDFAEVVGLVRSAIERLELAALTGTPPGGLN